MSLTEDAIKNTAVSYFVAALFIAGGIGGYFTMGHLEDPIFSVKKAIIITPYPGVMMIAFLTEKMGSSRWPIVK